MQITVKLPHKPAGVTTRSALAGEQVLLQTGGFHCSTEGETFFRIAEGLSAPYLAASLVSPSQVDILLAIVDRNNDAIVYINDLKITALVQSKVSAEAGQALMKNDLSEVREIDLGVEVPNDCGFLFIFSIGWRKGLLFDFGPLVPDVTRDFSVARAMGSAYGYVLANERFALSENEWNTLMSGGWFPFIGLQSETVARMIDFLRGGRDVDLLLPEILEQVDRIGKEATALSLNNEDFAVHASFIKTALERFEAGDFISAGSILFPRIEGMLRTFYLLTRPSNSPNQMRLLNIAFPADVTTRLTILRTDKFITYLETVIFSNFRWDNPTGATRHTVGHGIVDQKDLSDRSVLLAILTVHHLLFSLMSRRADILSDHKATSS